MRAPEPSTEEEVASLKPKPGQVYIQSNNENWGPAPVGRAGGLTIHMMEGGVQITDALGRARMLTTDREWRQAGATGESQSYWKKAKLVTRNRGRGQALTIREYSVNKKDQLVVSTEFQVVAGLGTYAYKLVYDRKPGA